MEFFERVSRLVQYFKSHGYTQFEGEHLLKAKDLDILEEMFGLSVEGY